MKRVYIAGPLSSSGGYVENVRAAVLAAEAVIQAGGMPHVPHLCALWQFISPHSEYGYWLPMDLEWLRLCHAVLRLPGASHGADAEVAEAQRVGLPVFHDMEALLVWMKE